MHAEMQCIRKASSMLSSWRLSECTLYTTLEPCAMCMGAIQASRVKRLVFGAKDIRMGACGSWVDLVNSAKDATEKKDTIIATTLLNIKGHPFHHVNVVGGVKEDECGTLLKRFFVLRRAEGADSKKKKMSKHVSVAVVADGVEDLNDFVERGSVV